MVTLLTIQVLSIIATALTNLVGILAFSTDHWSIVIYDFVKLRSNSKWFVVENTTNNHFHMINNTYEQNHTKIFSFNDQQLTTVAIGIKNDTILYKTHKGIFRRCNYLSENIRLHFNISKCRVLKVTNNQYDDAIHGMNNPGRELIRKYLILFSQEILAMSRPIISRRTEEEKTKKRIFLVNLTFSSFKKS